MWRQVWKLAEISLRNVGGWNRVRYGRDKKEKNKRILLLAVYGLIGAMIAGYSGLLAYGLGAMGMGDVIPAYVIAVLSVIILLFSMFTAGSVIFDRKTYELLAALPIEPAAIMVSRFLVMYLENLFMGLVVIIPAAAVYGVMSGPGLWFYPAMLLGAVLAPLLPMTIATLAGAVIMGIGSRMKHKNLVVIVLSMALTLGMIVFSMAPALKGTGFNKELFRNLAQSLQTRIYGLYPPARLFAEGVTGGRPLSFLLFAGLSVGTFLLMVWLVQRRFGSICMALHFRGNGGRQYVVVEERQKSVLSALYRKEMSRYLASSLWVINTMMGPALMILLAAGLLIAGPEMIGEMLELPEGLEGVAGRVLPFALAFPGSFSTTTVSAVSMEGKNWWLTQSLPVSAKQIFDAKMLVNLTVQLPCLALSVALLLAGKAVDSWHAVWLALIPLLYVLFVTALGITVNCKLPNMQWETEAAVVKQSAAMLVIVCVSFGAVLLPMIGAFALSGAAFHLEMGILACLLAAAAFLLYRKNVRVDIRKIQ